MLIYKHETPSLESIREFFYRTDNEFDIPLSQKVNVDEYTLKLYTHADFFVCYNDDKIVGMICCYMNRPPEAYISHVCVDPKYQGKGVFGELFVLLKDRCLKNTINSIALEVGLLNVKARLAYERKGFVISEKTNRSYYLRLAL